jgi:hypothetical protein
MPQLACVAEFGNTIAYVGFVKVFTTEMCVYVRCREEFITPQVGATCCYRSVLLACKHVLRQHIKWTASQVKAFSLLIRLGFVARLEREMTYLLRQGPRELGGTLMSRDDCTMIDLAISQTARALAKLKRAGDPAMTAVCVKADGLLTAAVGSVESGRCMSHCPLISEPLPPAGAVAAEPTWAWYRASLVQHAFAEASDLLTALNAASSRSHHADQSAVFQQLLVIPDAHPSYIALTLACGASLSLDELRRCDAAHSLTHYLYEYIARVPHVPKSYALTPMQLEHFRHVIGHGSEIESAGAAATTRSHMDITKKVVLAFCFLPREFVSAPRKPSSDTTAAGIAPHVAASGSCDGCSSSSFTLAVGSQSNSAVPFYDDVLPLETSSVSVFTGRLGAAIMADSASRFILQQCIETV